MWAVGGYREEANYPENPDSSRKGLRLPQLSGISGSLVKVAPSVVKAAHMVLMLWLGRIGKSRESVLASAVENCGYTRENGCQNCHPDRAE